MNLSMPVFLRGLSAIAASIIIMTSLPSEALSACQDIRNEEAYGKKRDSMVFLVEGSDGYLFISKKDLESKFEIDDKSVAYAKRFVDTLKSRGVNTVMVVQPPRGLVHQNKISAADKTLYAYDGKVAKDNFQAMIAHLRQSGFTVATLPDLSMSNYAYLRDHHWTAAGAKAVATDVATLVKAQPYYAALPKVKFTTDKGTANPKFSGALANGYADVCKTKLSPEKILEYKTTIANSKGGEASLFGDEAAPAAVLAGTSFSSNDAAHANFDGWLKESLSVDILNYAVRGGGFGSGVLSYLASDDYKNKKQSLLIWEMPSYLKFGSVSEWRELVAAPFGDCKGTKREVFSHDVTADDDKTEILSSKIAKDVSATGGYVYLSFDKDLEANGKLQAEKDGDKVWNASLTHSKRLEENLPYYMDLGAGETFDSLILTLKDKDIGRKVSVRACRYQ